MFKNVQRSWEYRWDISEYVCLRRMIYLILWYKSDICTEYLRVYYIKLNIYLIYIKLNTYLIY